MIRKSLFYMALSLISFYSRAEENIIDLPGISIVKEYDCKALYPFGAPPKVIAVTEPIILCHKGYAVQYNFENLLPFWSAEFLKLENLLKDQGERPKQDLFKPDPLLEQKGIESIKKEQYKNPHGDKACFDRGHMAPAGDFEWDILEGEDNPISAMRESFYLSNIVPQHPKNNQQIWAFLEKNVRNWVFKNKNDLYVITGPIFTKEAKIKYNNLSIPDFLYKVIIDTREHKSTAFIVPNKDVEKEKLENYRTSVSNVQNITGIDFLGEIQVNDTPEKFPLKDFSINFNPSIPESCSQYYYMYEE